MDRDTLRFREELKIQAFSDVCNASLLKDKDKDRDRGKGEKVKRAST